MKIIVETERLFLREMEMGDYDALYQVLADLDIMRHYPYTGHLAVRLRRRSMRNWQQRNPLMPKWNTDYNNFKFV